MRVILRSSDRTMWALAAGGNQLYVVLRKTFVDRFNCRGGFAILIHENREQRKTYFQILTRREAEGGLLSAGKRTNHWFWVGNGRCIGAARDVLSTENQVRPIAECWLDNSRRDRNQAHRSRARCAPCVTNCNCNYPSGCNDHVVRTNLR